MELEVTVNNAMSPRSHCQLLKVDVSSGGGPLFGYIQPEYSAAHRNGFRKKTRKKNMTFQFNIEENRRVSSFRIDDILASPEKSRSETFSRASGGSLDTLPSLSFGVDQILASRTSENKNEIRCYGKKLKSDLLTLVRFL